jgi:hypothetical protein
MAAASSRSAGRIAVPFATPARQLALLQQSAPLANDERERALGD